MATENLGNPVTVPNEFSDASLFYIMDYDLHSVSRPQQRVNFHQFMWPSIRGLIDYKRVNGGQVMFAQAGSNMDGDRGADERSTEQSYLLTKTIQPVSSTSSTTLASSTPEVADISRFASPYTPN